MRYVAIIRGDEVVNVVVAADDDTLQDLATLHDADESIDVAGFEVRPSVGWRRVGDEFRPDSPYPSWVWNGQMWESPVPLPEETAPWEWDEDTVSWKKGTPPPRPQAAS